MKKVFLFVAMAAVVACSKPVFDEDIEGDEELTEVDMTKTKKFTFTVKGDFVIEQEEPTRGYLTAEDNQMTDLWVFDFIGGSCVQSIHQVKTDDDWGQPVLSLAYGSHHVYFVASRGTGPTLNETAKTITWTKPSDTFWEDYEVTVVSTSNGNRAVTLDRVVTKLKVTIEDQVPTGMATLSITPANWYCGMSYQTGEPSDARTNESRVINVPDSYVGTSGQLSASIFGFSSESEWDTDITVTAKDGSNQTLGSASIADAPFKRNRTTEFSGPLFGTSGATAVSVNEDWLDAYTGSW